MNRKRVLGLVSLIALVTLPASVYALDTAIIWDGGKAYLTSGGQYIRYDVKADKPDPGYPKPINSATWPGVPFARFDAAINWGNGKAYIFSGNQYVRYDIKSEKTDPGYPKPINEANWPGVAFLKGVDAAINWGNGKAYFFSGNQYVRYDLKADKADSGYPQAINEANWPGLSFTRVDAALNWGNGKAYLFSGNRYVRYDLTTDKVDSGYPKTINEDTWPGLSFMGTASSGSSSIPTPPTTPPPTRPPSNPPMEGGLPPVPPPH